MGVDHGKCSTFGQDGRGRMNKWTMDTEEEAQASEEKDSYLVSGTVTCIAIE